MHEHDNDPVKRLVHLYEDGAIKRRDLIRRVLRHTGSIALAAAALKGIPAEAHWCPSDVSVPENVPDLEGRFVELQGEAGPLYSYLVRPNPQDAPLPAILVIHENRGLNEHIRDVTRRAARYGFVALAVDLLSREGGAHNIPDPDDAVRAYGRLSAAGMLADLQTAVAALKGWSFVRPERIGVVGFCAGGGNTWNLAVNSTDIAAAVPFYGPPPMPDQISRLGGPVLAIYAELDRTLTGRMAPVVTAMLEQRKPFGLFVYEGANHAFHNDTGPRYDPEAACDAWSKTIAFFDKHLRRSDP